MKKIYLFLSIVLLLSTIAIGGGDNNFTVLAINGSVKYSNDGKNFKDLTESVVLEKRTMVKLEKDAYLGLVHSSGKTAEIAESGIFKIEDLIKSIKAGSSKLTKRLTKYVLNEMSSVDDLVASDDYHKSMYLTGTAKRGAGDFDILMISPPKTAFWLAPVTLKWEDPTEMNNYLVVIRDFFDDVISKQPIDDSSFEVDLSTLPLESDKFYILKIIGSQDPQPESDEIAFRVVDQDTTREIMDKINEIEENTIPGSAIASIMKAKVFEEYDLLMQADQEYSSAVEKSGGAKAYKKMHKGFLQRVINM